MNTKRGSKRLRAAIVQHMDEEMRTEVAGIGVRHEENKASGSMRNTKTEGHYFVEWDRIGKRHVLHLHARSDEKHPERFAHSVLETMKNWPSNKDAAQFYARLSRTLKAPVGIPLPYGSWHAVILSKKYGSQCYSARMLDGQEGLYVHEDLSEDVKYTTMINVAAKNFAATCQVDTLLVAQLHNEGLLARHGAGTQGYEDGEHKVGSLPINVSHNGLRQIIAAHRLGGSDTGDILYEDGNILVEGINAAQTVLAGLAGQKVSAVTGEGTRFDDELIAAARNIKHGGAPTLLLKLQSRRLTLKKAQRMYGVSEPDMPHEKASRNKKNTGKTLLR